MIKGKSSLRYSNNYLELDVLTEREAYIGILKSTCDSFDDDQQD